MAPKSCGEALVGNSLFDPVQLGELSLSNAVVMAPMTRSRAGAGDAPTELHIEYYRQRASAGLIITEGVQPSKHGKGYCRTPGLHTQQQTEAWRQVTDAVHAEGGQIVAQLMHCGRIGAAINKDPDAETVAPSAIRANVEVWTDTSMAPVDMPRELALEEIPSVIEEYAHAARCAMEAGFDGVELHCTSGYLPMQFLSTGTNKRRDGYGGSVSGRIRFVVETLEALAAAIGPGRVGFRICPGNPYNDIHDDDPVATYSALLDAASPLRLAYLHIIRTPPGGVDVPALARKHFQGSLIINGGFTAERGQRALDAGQAEAVSFGSPFIANPDLVRRMREGLPLAEADPEKTYTIGAAGYIDYPFHP